MLWLARRLAELARKGGLISNQPRSVLKELFVKQNARGKDMGRALIDKDVTQAITLRSARLKWDVLPFKERPKVFYRRFGGAPDSDWEAWTLVFDGASKLRPDNRYSSLKKHQHSFILQSFVIKKKPRCVCTGPTERCLSYSSHQRRKSMKALALLNMLFRYFSVLFERSRQRNELRELDDRALRDIGLTRDEVLRVANKPLWRR